MNTPSFVGQYKKSCSTTTRYKIRSYNPHDSLHGLEDVIKTAMTDLEKEWYDLSKRIYKELSTIESLVVGNKVEISLCYDIESPVKEIQ